MAKSYKIFPSIGIARVGNSESEHYLAPDSPQKDFVPQGGYRDGNNKIKRMGQTFRIYEFEGDTAVREITSAEADIVWEVELCNSKPAKPGLNGDIPLERLTCKSANYVQGAGASAELRGIITPNQTPISIKLGNIHTNDKAELVVLGGHGLAGTWDRSEPSEIQNSGWWDDTSDGPVRATLQLRGSDEAVEAESAWVLVGVADFAHANLAIVTLYDLARDRSGVRLPDGDVSFSREIFPLLHRVVLMQWVNSNAQSGHSRGRGNFLESSTFALMHDKAVPGGAAARKRVFNMLSKPGGGGGNMPALSGGLTVTPLQYEAFMRWSNDQFADDWNSGWDPFNPPQPAFVDIPIKDQPDALNQASLGSGIGGSFFPGIEGGARMAEETAYQKPFRVSRTVNSGDLTHDLGIPWHADFKFCSESWWPSGRPGDVAVPAGGNVQFKEWTRGINGSKEMVDNWSKLGFIIKDTNAPTRYIETQRTLPGTFTLADKVASLQASMARTKARASRP